MKKIIVAIVAMVTITGIAITVICMPIDRLD